MSDQPTFDGIACPILPHDLHDRWLTPDKLATACYGMVTSRAGTSFYPETVLEPSVGGGAFIRAIRARRELYLRIVAIDIDPSAAGLLLADKAIVGDWTTCEMSVFDRPDLVIGNPPFSGDTALDHVERARNAINRLGVVAFILPLSYLGVQRWDRHVSQCASVDRIVGRPWSVLREVALYVWTDREDYDRGPMRRVEWV